jgi:hypothetical protein
VSGPVAKYLATGFCAAVLATGLVFASPTDPTSVSDTDSNAPGAALNFPEHVSANGAYETNFDIPVPPAPAAPRLSLFYDSQINGTLAGAGWDLSVGWPTTIFRDVRFGTPQWNRGSNWLWGAAPLVLSKAPAVGKCTLDPSGTRLAGDCGFEYRLAPEVLTSVSIDLAAGRERATVRTPNGATLDYEPILYDGMNFPNAPAGAETSVFGFRLASVLDHNGYRTCFRYKPPIPPTGSGTNDLPDEGGHWGESALLSEIVYGPTPTQGDCNSSAFQSAHKIKFHYSDLAPRFFRTFTLRFGAPASFNSLLDEVSVYVAGAQNPQDTFLLEYGAQASETRRPLLTQISQQVATSQTPWRTTSRVVRSFGYGSRNLQFGTSELFELGPLNSAPDSLAGTISRPIRRANPLANSDLFQFGPDQSTDAAPPTHATTQQWLFTDINGDGLPDIQWSDETGVGTKWPGFEKSVPTAPRPAQQQVLINEGLVGSTLATMPVQINSHANEADSQSLETLYAPVPAFGTGFTPWFWAEGRGNTRTGMPVSVSAPEIPKVLGACNILAFDPGKDTRLWPMYPDGTFGGSQGSVGDLIAAANPFPPGGNNYIGNPAVKAALNIFSAYHPSYAVSSTVSAWTTFAGPRGYCLQRWLGGVYLRIRCLNRQSKLRSHSAGYDEPEPCRESRPARRH